MCVFQGIWYPHHFVPIVVCILGIWYSQVFCANFSVYSRDFIFPIIWCVFWGLDIANYFVPIFVCILGIFNPLLFCANIRVYSRGFDIPKCWIRFWSQFPSWGLATLRWPSTCGFLHLLIFSFAYLPTSALLECIFAYIKCS